MLFSIKSNEPLSMELRLYVEGNNKSLLEHIQDQNQGKYNKKVFRKYIRLYNLDPKKLIHNDRKLHIYHELKDLLLDDFASQCLQAQSYYIFKSIPFLNIRPIIGVIFGCRYDANSHFVLTTVQKKIEAKMFKKEHKLYYANKKRFEQKHYLDTFNLLTQNDRELWWNATQHPREQLNYMMDTHC